MGNGELAIEGEMTGREAGQSPGDQVSTAKAHAEGGKDEQDNGGDVENDTQH